MKKLFLSSILILWVIFCHAQSYSRIRNYMELDYTRTEKIGVSENVAFEFRNNRSHAFSFGYHLGKQQHYFNLAYQIALFQDSRKRVLFVENRYLYRLFP